MKTVAVPSETICNIKIFQKYRVFYQCISITRIFVTAWRTDYYLLFFWRR